MDEFNFEWLGKGLRKFLGSRNDRIIRDLAPIVGKVNALEPEFEKLSDARLAAKTPEFKERLKKGEKLDSLLPEAFGVCREAAKRNLGMRPFDVQLLGGVVLHQGKIAEMATGEGKTLVATLPAYLNALEARGVHVVTVNDYLARRDAKWMGAIFKALGMEVGVIQAQMPNAQRLRAYRADITYGTNSEFGFDYLRDNMKLRYDDQTQQGRHHYAIVDEVDSILIDEARTPLIIAGPAEESADRYYVVDRIVKQLKDGTDYEVNEKDHHVVLTEEGIETAQRIANVGSFYDPQNIDWPHHIDQALKANYLYKKDKEYVVDDGEEGPEIVIVDEFTGRKMAGRRWSDGLHQAVEAKEGVQIRAENQTLATITYQNFFRLYKKLSGMTGTALTEAPEFVKIYSLDVVTIPTNRRLRRPATDDLIYRTEAEKWRAVVAEIEKVHKAGRPVLVGTTSVAKSEILSSLLNGNPMPPAMIEALRKSRPPKKGGVAADLQKGARDAIGAAAADPDAKDFEPFLKEPIRHDLLNAKQHEREANIIAKAGETGAVVIATNMAGRGTDIILGPGVAEKGGLHVVGTERHEARRIDNQLRGRAGRQGDPGSSQFFLSLEDDLMRIFAKDWVGTMLQKLGMEEGQEIQSPLVSRMIERVQKKMEAHNFDIRKNLLEYDHVNNEQRKEIYGWRQTILEGADQGDRIEWFTVESCKRMAETYLVKNEAGEPLEIDKFRRAFQQRYNGEAPSAEAFAEVSVEEGGKLLLERAKAIYRERREKVGAERLQSLERFVLLQTIDEKWKDHLHALDYLRTGVGMRGYGQEDPKIVYRREAATYFGQMLGAIQDQVVDLVFHVEPPQPTREIDEIPGEEIEAEAAPQGAAATGAPAFDDDDWGPDDDDTDWDAVLAAPPVAIGTSPQQAPAATMQTELDVSTSTATMGAPPIAVSHVPPSATMSDGASAAQPASEQRDEPKRTAARLPAARPAADPLFAKPAVDPNAMCPCGSGKKYKKCHGS
jgi:preprotein translocase subunit SecA